MKDGEKVEAILDKWVDSYALVSCSNEEIETHFKGRSLTCLDFIHKRLGHTPLKVKATLEVGEGPFLFGVGFFLCKLTFQGLLEPTNHVADELLLWLDMIDKPFNITIEAIK